MQERREAVEDANAAADMERINQASRNLASTIGEGMSFIFKLPKSAKKKRIGT